MSYISDVRLVGELTKDVEINTSKQGKSYAILNLRTGKPINSKWVFSQHRVVVFRADLMDFLSKQVKGTWLKVSGELGYLNGGNTAQIVVNSDGGSVGLMFRELWKTDAAITDEEFALIEANGGLTTVADQTASGVGSSTTGTGQGTDMSDEIPF
jgi:hypothetical protein